MKRLIIFRHGKSDWYAPSKSDHDRPLNKRGRRSAEAMGIALANANQAPQHVISSSATRAHTTAEIARTAGDWTSTLELTDRLYGTSVDGALQVVAGSDPGIDHLMLVGHEPTWSALVAHLTGASVQVKTATVVAIDLLISGWAGAETARGEIVYVLQPRLFTSADAPPID
jgi:phosphohistidine phosphatase